MGRVQTHTDLELNGNVRDAFLDPAMRTPEFDELLSEAKKCQSDFLAQRSQPAQ